MRLVQMLPSSHSSSDTAGQVTIDGYSLSIVRISSGEGISDNYEISEKYNGRTIINVWVKEEALGSEGVRYCFTSSLSFPNTHDKSFSVSNLYGLEQMMVRCGRFARLRREEVQLHRHSIL